MRKNDSQTALREMLTRLHAPSGWDNPAEQHRLSSTAMLVLDLD